MKLSLQDNVTSTQDLKAVILEVRTYAKWFGQTVVKMHLKRGSSYKPPIISQPAVNLINGCSTNQQISQKSLDELIAALEDLEATAPHISVALAAPPPGDLKKTLTEWFRKNIAPNILVDFSFNSTILGGMVIQYGSHVYDWSFKRQILASREHFPEVLRHV
jgi:hypothetical protein